MGKGEMKWIIGSFIASMGVTSPAHADILAIVIDERSLPYDLNSSNYDNSPSNYENSSANYDNSASNYDNSASNYDNSRSNYNNGPSGNRSVYTNDGERVGYYVWSDKGVLNFYNSSGRVFYMPSGGHTQSVFRSEGREWCGTLGEMNGQTVLGLTRNCLLQMMME